MKSILLINESIILIFYCISRIITPTITTKDLVYISLVYIIIRLLYYIFNNEKSKLINSIVTIVVISLIAYYKDKLFLIFIPSILIMMGRLLNISKLYVLVAIGSIPLVIRNLDISIYYLIALINYNFINDHYRSRDILDKRNRAIDELRAIISKLRTRLEKNEEYEKNLENITKLMERNTIAQEIHDEVGHILAGSIMQLEASKVLVESNPKKATSLMDNTIDVLKGGMDRIRLTLRTIKPEVQEIGINRIKALLSDVRQNTSINIFFEYDDATTQLTNKQWIAIEKNIKEAVTNTIKYSKATKINISIKKLNKLYKIAITDDGVGSVNIIKGLGIRGIEERTEKIGATLIIDGSKGFSVIMLVPNH